MVTHVGAFLRQRIVPALLGFVAFIGAAPSPDPGATPPVIQQESSDVDETSPIQSWMLQTFYTSASYGPGNVRVLQIIPRFDTIRIGQSYARVTLPRYQWIQGVGTGMGDSQLAYLFTNPIPSGRFGIGVNAYIPSASGPMQGIGTWGIGPAAAAVKFNAASQTAIGFSIQSLFSYAGPSNRVRQSAATFAPFFVKQLGSGWSLRSADAMWTFDFQRGSTLLPVSLGVGKLITFGTHSLNVALSDTVTVVHANAPTLPKNTWKLAIRLMNLVGNPLAQLPH
ncbi:MAG: hypothetical protein WAK16_11565 [Candidatus Cybelea sp.]